MIFVTVGTHEAQFNRLVRAVDELKGSGRITEDVVIQTGYSDYIPKHCTYHDFYTYEEMDKLVSEARIVVTHGGPSSFFAVLQKGKTPIVVPRQKEYEEHVNDHQLVFVGQVEERYHNIIVVRDTDELGNILNRYDEIAASMTKSEGSRNAEFCRRFRDIAAFVEPKWNLRKLPDDVQHVFVVGAKGFTYGGYETFLRKLTEYHQGEKRLQYHIACKANGAGRTDEKSLPGAEMVSYSEYLFQNAHCFKIKSPDLKSAQAIFYDILALRYCVRYIKKHRIPNPIVYVLSSRVGPVMGHYARKIHRLGGRYYHNPDGRENLRKKYSKLVRSYWKMSEAGMVKHSDLEICDSKSIEGYIKEEYAKYSPATTFIAYGAESEASKLSDTAPEFVEWIQKHGVRPGEYYVSIGRMVEENNFETMIREFMLSSTKKDYVIIANANGKLYNALEEKYHFSSDPRIKFVGTVYNQELLKKIRENAFAYFHGHEVGGTNPSLLESLASTQLNLLYGVNFNREVAEEAGLYWTKDRHNLADLIDKVDGFSAETISEYSAAAKKRIRDHYSWGLITDRYREVFLK